MDRNAVSLLILLLSVGFLAYCASTPDETPETVEGAPSPPQVVATGLADLFPTKGKRNQRKRNLRGDKRNRQDCC